MNYDLHVYSGKYGSWNALVKIFTDITDLSQSVKILTTKILIPGFVTGIALARSRRGLGADVTAKILTAKIQKWPICESFNP